MKEIWRLPTDVIKLLSRAYKITYMLMQDELKLINVMLLKFPSFLCLCKRSERSFKMKSNL